SQLITLAVQPFAFTVSLPSFVAPLEANVVTTHSQHGTIYHHLGGSLSPERGSPCTNCSRLTWARTSTDSTDWSLGESCVSRRRESSTTQKHGASCGTSYGDKEASVRRAWPASSAIKTWTVT